MRRRLAPTILAAAALAALAVTSGCTRTETEEQVKYVYDPYQGDAFPNRRPKFTLPNGDVGLTSDNGSDTVTLFDLTNDKPLGKAPVGRDPVDIDGPHHIAADRSRGFVYVALAYPAPAILPGPHAAHGSSARAGYVQKLALDDLRPLGEVRVDPNPGDIVLSDDGKRIVVSHFDLQRVLTSGGDVEKARARLAVIDPEKLLASGSPEPTWITTCVAPHGMALSRPDGRWAYVACYGEDVIAVVDLDNPATPVERVQVGPSPGNPGSPSYGPYATALSPSGKTLAVGNTESKDTRLFDVTTKTVLQPAIKTTGAPYFAAWSKDEAKLYIPTQSPDALVVADPATGQALMQRDFDAATCTLPHELVFSSDGATLYLVCEGDHAAPGNVLALDPATLDVKANMPAGVYPDRMVLMGAP